MLFIMTFLFQYFFEPFTVYEPEHKMNYFWITLIHASTPVVVLGFFSFSRIIPSNAEDWTVGKEMRLIALYLLGIGVYQFLIRDIIYDNIPAGIVLILDNAILSVNDTFL